MKSWLRFGTMAMGVCLVVTLAHPAAAAKGRDSVPLDTGDTQKVLKTAPAAPKPDAKVDTFVDKNNDGIDDRRQSKVVRPQKTETKQKTAKESQDVKDRSREKTRTQKKPPRLNTP